MTGPAQFQAIVLTDGHCNLCDRTIRYLVRNDPERRLRFAAQQSSPGRELLHRAGLSSDLQPGVVLLDAEGRHPRIGSAALPPLGRILAPRARMLRWFAALPPFLRAPVYHVVAGSRYRIFGRKTACGIDPAASIPERRFKAQDLETLP